MFSKPKPFRQINKKDLLGHLKNIISSGSIAFAVVLIGKAMQISNYTDFYLIMKASITSGIFVVMFIGLMVAFNKLAGQLPGKQSTSVRMTSGLFTIFTVVGQLADLTPNLPHEHVGKIIVLEIINLVGLFLLYQFVVSKIFSWFDQWINQTANNKLEVRQSVIKIAIKRHFFIFSFSVILICWLSIQFWLLPGIINYDGYNQLNQFFGLPVWSKTMPLAWSQHHPLLSTLVMGGIMQPFMQFGADKAVFAYTTVQTLFNAFAMAYATTRIVKWTDSLKFTIGSVLFFALSPVFAIDNTSVVKDTLFIGIYLLVGVFFADLLICGVQKRKYSMKVIVGFSFFATLAMLYRANGVYVVIPAVLLLICINSRHVNRLIALIILVTTFGTYQITDTLLAKHYQATPTEITEALSIPLQQTARTLKYKPETVTQKESQAINQVIDVSKTAELYDPLSSDAVKRSLRFNGNVVTKHQVLNYLKQAWLPGLLKAPVTYIKATLYNTYLYYYPWSNRTVQPAVLLSNNVAKPMKTAMFDYNMWFGVDETTNPYFIKYIDWLRTTLPMGVLFNNALPFWLFIGLAIYLFSRKYYMGLLLLCGPALNFLVLLASPINGLLRYTTPVVTWLPIVVAVAFVVGRLFNDEEQLKSKENLDIS
ncbi:MAG: DUF6020 family protein [Lactobacillaceae bacterium]|jgi:hypothetical protein|nr:DUF6020 family protein [Lactobacillaceae bacterium]